MNLRLATILGCSLLGAACTKEKPADKPADKAPGKPTGKPADDAACGPLSVTVDGKPVDGLTHAHALTQKSGEDTNEQIHLFNYEVTCAQVLEAAGREIPDGSLWVRAGVGKTVTTRGVGFNDYTQIDVDVKLTSPAATKPGDQVSMCVPKTELEPTKGLHAGKKVVVSGTMTAPWCGVMEL